MPSSTETDARHGDPPASNPGAPLAAARAAFDDARPVWLIALLVAAALTIAAIAAKALLVRELPGPAYLPLHTLLELVSSMVGLAVFAVQWYAAQPGRVRDPRALLLGTGFLAVAAIDLLHAMTFKGMPGLVVDGSVEHAIYYWLAGRLWTVAALLSAALLPMGARPRWIARAPLAAINLAVVVGVFAADSWIPRDHGWFFHEGRGLTPLKIGLEYAVIVLSLVAGAIFLRRFARTRERGLLGLSIALLITVASELCFTLYAAPYDPFNLLGHLLKVLAYFVVFDALFVSAFLRPYRELESTAGELSASNAELKRLRDHIQGELADTIARLERTSASEREARKRAEEANERLRAIESISESALTHLDADRLLDELLRRLRDVLRVDAATLLTMADDGTHLEVRASHGLEDEVAAGVRIAVGSGFAGAIAASREAMIVEDSARIEVASPFLRRLRSLAGVPVVLEARLIGVLHVGTREPRRFAPDDVNLLQVVADRVGAAMERARTFAELSATIGSMPNAVFLYDTRGEILLSNPAGDALLGYTEQEKHLDVHERMARLRAESPERHPLPIEQLPPMRALRGETVHGEIVVLHRPPDRRLWVSASAAPIRAASGRQIGAVLTFTDITALHDLQEQREDILRMVSHDLRTPLTAIQLQAQRLTRSLTAEGQPRDLKSAQAIVTSSRRMSSMIQDLVDSVRLASGQVRLEPQAVDLGAFASDVLARAAGAYTTSRVSLEIPSDLPLAKADPNRLERILTNLVTNAIKYSPDPSPVQLSAREQAGELVVGVRDQGPGIPSDEQAKLFQRFFRARGAERAEGLGLGLYITRMLVEAHGGRIWVDSKPGEGSAFWFTLPPAS